MKQVEFFKWMLPPDIWRKKPSPSRHYMSREEAAERYPTATPIESTREVRNLCETEEELRAYVRSLNVHGANKNARGPRG